MTPNAPDSDLFSRRTLLRRAGSGLIAFSGAHMIPTGLLPDALAGSEAVGSPALVPLNRFPRMMQDFVVDRVRAVERAGDLRRSKIRTKADAEGYAQEVRAKIVNCFGPLPEKSPLNARVGRVLDRDTYQIENVTFESRPGFLVTGNLYLPKDRSFPAPAVLGACGHSDRSKAAVTYQSFAQGLARQGYVVFMFDPIGLGERLQYLTAEHQPRKGTRGVREHLLTGNQQLLVGENFAAWNLWDGMRALDYLLSRPEVDARHVGVTGNSGGGTLATWLCAMDARLTMAAPSCFVTTLRRNAENELPVDAEQCVPGVLGAGLDHSDFFVPFAPRPVCLLGQERDFFDARGFEEAGRRLAKFNHALGADTAMSQFLGRSTHGYSQENREAMYRFFNATTGTAGDGTEPPLTLESLESLRCTTGGQVAMHGSRTVFSFTRERSQALASVRVAVEGEALLACLRDVLQLPPREQTPDYRILRPVENRGYPKKHAATYAVETEAPAMAIVYRLDENELLARPPTGVKRAILYVADRSADAELRDEPLLHELVRQEHETCLFACDVRGIGESQPNTCGTAFEHHYGGDYFYAVHGIMLNRPYPGQRTHDVLRVLDWLAACGHSDIHLVARGWGTIPATFAAVLSPHVTKVTLKGALASFSSVAETEDYHWPLSALLPGVLQRFDLPDCYRALTAKNLTQLELSPA